MARAMHWRVVNLESSFVTAVVDILFFALEWIVTRDVDAKVIEFRPTIRHPVREHLTGTRTILTHTDSQYQRPRTSGDSPI